VWATIMTTKKPTRPNKVQTAVRLTEQLLSELDEFCLSQKLPPSRTRVIEAAIRDYIEREKPPVRMSR
jgi:metal-responsive CopG/Arc/MetJ family transcriptional regulator